MTVNINNLDVIYYKKSRKSLNKWKNLTVIFLKTPILQSSFLSKMFTSLSI